MRTTSPAFAALALHRHPEWRDQVRGGDGSLRRAFSCDVEVHDPDGSAAILVATRP